MISLTVASIAFAAFVLAIQTTAFEINSLRTNPVQKRDSPQMDMNSIRTALDGLDSDLENKQKRTCAIGINSHHCALANMDNRMLSREWLSNGDSPGKRSGEITPEAHSQAERLLAELAVKRQAISTLKHLLLKLKDREVPSAPVRKRSCSVRLGGLCLTESLDRAASQYYYLRSPHSPGKRRRRDVTSQQKP